jgi:hypothetical protein
MVLLQANNGDEQKGEEEEFWEAGGFLEKENA